MKRKKLKPEPPKYDYFLIITLKYDELKKKNFTIIRLETTQEFINFKYDLSIKEENYAKKIVYKILGINTPRLLISGGGPAFYEKTYEQLSGEYQIEVVNLDGVSNIFKIKVLKNVIKLLDAEMKSFVDIEIK